MVDPAAPGPPDGALPAIPPFGLPPIAGGAGPGGFAVPGVGRIPPPPVVNFSLTPTLGGSDEVLDLGNRYGQQLHEMITKPFPTKFDGEPENCLTFIEHVLERSIKARWDRTTSCKINGTGNGPLLFKLIMSECVIDTPSIIIQTREKLMNLATYMVTVQGDSYGYSKVIKLTRTPSSLITINARRTCMTREFKLRYWALSKQLISKLKQFKDKVGPRENRNPGNSNRSRSDNFRNGYRVCTSTHKWRGVPPEEGKP